MQWCLPLHDLHVCSQQHVQASLATKSQQGLCVTDVYVLYCPPSSAAHESHCGVTYVYAHQWWAVGDNLSEQSMFTYGLSYNKESKQGVRQKWVRFSQELSRSSRTRHVHLTNFFFVLCARPTRWRTGAALPRAAHSPNEAAGTTRAPFPIPTETCHFIQRTIKSRVGAGTATLSRNVSSTCPSSTCDDEHLHSPQPRLPAPADQQAGGVGTFWHITGPVDTAASRCPEWP